MEGDAAFYEETEDGETEIYLTDRWAKAERSLAHAAMALGASGYVNEKDRDILLQGWNSLQQI